MPASATAPAARRVAGKLWHQQHSCMEFRALFPKSWVELNWAYVPFGMLTASELFPNARLPRDKLVNVLVSLAKDDLSRRPGVRVRSRIRSFESKSWRRAWFRGWLPSAAAVLPLRVQPCWVFGRVSLPV
jgi:hypothetical protein